MLDIKYIRENKELVAENTKQRKVLVSIDELLADDDLRRELASEIDKLRREINQGSKNKPSEEEIIKLRKIGGKISSLEKELKEIQAKIHDKLSWIPNLSSPEMPIGKGEEDNIELAVWTPQDGYLPKAKLGTGDSAIQYMKTNPTGKHHLEIGEGLDILDNKQSALTSGSRFTYLKGDGAMLEYALFDLLSKKLIKSGFTPMLPPLMVREQVLFGTSHFPEGRDQVYKIEKSNIEEGAELYLIGSAEPALFAYYMDKTIPEKKLPVKMFALTSCFRSEVGSWGKDVRGIKRVHQFDKLEMNVVCHPDQSAEIFAELAGINEWLLQSLKLPYRLLNKCTGDCGYSATYKQYDIEVWLPSQREFMEVMTDTNTTDYQARRLNIKYQSGDKKNYVHTVNDTGCAMGRMIVAILDNYQNPDGSVTIPEALQEYMGKKIISRS